MRKIMKKYKLNMRRIKKIKKIFQSVYLAISIMLIAWVIISYIDVVSHNLSGGTDDPYNFFVVMANSF